MQFPPQTKYRQTRIGISPPNNINLQTIFGFLNLQTDQSIRASELRIVLDCLASYPVHALMHFFGWKFQKFIEPKIFFSQNSRRICSKFRALKLYRSTQLTCSWKSNFGRLDCDYIQTKFNEFSTSVNSPFVLHENTATAFVSIHRIKSEKGFVK